jgi:hypothetical protein
MTLKSSFFNNFLLDWIKFPNFSPLW